MFLQPKCGQIATSLETPGAYLWSRRSGVRVPSLTLREKRKRSVGRCGQAPAESGQQGDRGAAGVVGEHVGEVVKQAAGLEAAGGVRRQQSGDPSFAVG
jgi:hypothetical protein